MYSSYKTLANPTSEDTMMRTATTQPSRRATPLSMPRALTKQPLFRASPDEAKSTTAFASAKPAAEGQFDDASDDEYESPIAAPTASISRRRTTRVAPAKKPAAARAVPKTASVAVARTEVPTTTESTRDILAKAMSPYATAEDLFKLEQLYRQADPEMIAREPLLQEMLREENELLKRYHAFQQRQALQMAREQEALGMIYRASLAGANPAVVAAAQQAQQELMAEQMAAAAAAQAEHSERTAKPAASFESTASSQDGSLQWLALACGQEMEKEEEQDKKRGGIPEPAINALLGLAKVTPDALQDDERKEAALDDEPRDPNRKRTRWEELVDASVTAEEEIIKKAIKTKNGPRKPQKSWTERVEELQAYHDHFGHCQVRQYAAGASLERELAAWLANCRCRYRGGTLKAEKAEELRALGCEGFTLEEAENAAAAAAAAGASKDKDVKIHFKKLTKRKDNKPPSKIVISNSHQQDKDDRSEHSSRTGTVGIRVGGDMARLSFTQPDVQPAVFGTTRNTKPDVQPTVFGTMRKPDPPGETDAVDETPPVTSEQRSYVEEYATALQQQMSALANSPVAQPTVITALPAASSGSINDPALDKKHRKRKSFDERLEQMMDFYKEHGHFQVLTRGEHSDLGRWLSNTRTKLRDGKLAPELKEKLTAVLRSTVAPRTQEPDADPAAVSRRSSGASTTTTPAMTDEDQNTNEDAASGPEAAVSAASNSRKNPKLWEDSFAELEEFKKEFGHCNVRIQKDDKYESLGRWLASNRCRFKMGQLQPDKALRLQHIGCTGFEDDSVGLVNYNAMHGYSTNSVQSPVVRKPTIDPYSNVGDRDDDSSSNKRKQGSEDSVVSYESDAESSAQKRVLDSLSSLVAQVTAFKLLRGHVNIRTTCDDKEEEKLGKWLESVRARHKFGALRADFAAALHELGCSGFEPSNGTIVPCEGGCSDDGHEDNQSSDGASSTEPSRKKRCLPPRQSFDYMLKELIEFQQQHGVNASVPKPEGDEGKLGRWLAFQRRQYRAGKLTLDRVQALHATGRHGFDPASMNSGGLASESISDSEDDAASLPVVSSGNMAAAVDP